MVRHEDPHNTPDQVREYLRDALRLVDDLEPPDDLRAVFFGKAVDMLSAKQIILEQAQALPDLGRNFGRPPGR